MGAKCARKVLKLGNLRVWAEGGKQGQQDVMVLALKEQRRLWPGRWEAFRNEKGQEASFPPEPP